MHSLDIRGKKMAYQDVGNGPVLVFGHSFLWDSAMWKPQVDVLSQHYRCIVPDLWAHGASDFAPDSTTNLIDYADDVLALIDALEIDTFSIVGLSVGGMWGAELAITASSRVNALVLMDTFIGFEPEVTHAKYFAIMDMIESAEMVAPPLVDTVAPMFFSRNAAETAPELVAGFREKLSNLKGEQAKQVVRIGRMVFGRRDTFDDIAKLTAPTLILVGDQDMPRPPLESQLMHDEIKGSEYQVIQGAGHISNLEQVDQVTDYLFDFLARQHA
ncbi:alpha/beta fold hydrolase [Enterovibrio sp. Hal110]